MLANIADIQAWVSDDRLEVDASNSNDFQLDVERLIKSTLSGAFTPILFHSWEDPETTPGLIRSIAGELIASYIYRRAYSEDVIEDNRYAQWLYNDAITKLAGIKTGTLTVLDENDEPIAINTLDSGSGDCWPNNTTAGPYATMDKQFA